MNHLTVNLLTLLLMALTAPAAFYITRYFQNADQQRTVGCLVAAACPHCQQTYGDELLETVVRVQYRWTPLPGNTVASFGLPNLTFLASCPHCLAQVEYRDNAQVFVHPQSGILDFTRQVLPKSRLASPSTTAATRNSNPAF